MKLRKMDVVIPATLESNVVSLHTFLYGEENYQPSSTVKNISAHIAEVSGVTKPMENAEEAGTGGGTVRKKDKKQEGKSEKKKEGEKQESSTEQTKESKLETEEESSSREEESSIEVKKESKESKTEEEDKNTGGNGSFGPAGDIGNNQEEGPEENVENP